jgi:hypothetical protein
MKELLKFGIPCMVYSQIWLNLPIGDHHFSCITKFINKTLRSQLSISSLSHLFIFKLLINNNNNTIIIITFALFN